MKKVFNNYVTITIIIIVIFFIFYIVNINLKINRFEKFENESTIPKIIIQTWKDNKIPYKYKNDIESVKKYNPKYKYLFFTDKDIEIFLKNYYPIYYSTYLKLPILIQKIDFFRYVAVYHYGGFYFDLDMTGLYPLDDLLDYDCIFPVDQNIRPDRCNVKRLKKYCQNGMNILLGQYAFGAKPKNNFIKKLIDNIHHNIDTYIEDYKTEGQTLQYVYSSTGPDYVTDVYMEYNKKDDIHILEYDAAQFFGKYAKHNFYGTWKKNKNG